MSILFKRFDLESSVRLYAMFIERTKAEQKRLGREDFTIKKKEILRFAKRHYREMEAEGLGCWNGRQIRNAFQVSGCPHLNTWKIWLRKANQYLNRLLLRFASMRARNEAQINTSPNSEGRISRRWPAAPKNSTDI